MALSKVLATVLVLAVGMPPLAYAQSTPPSGTWKEIKKNTTGTWRRVEKKIETYYGDSPKLQATVEGAASVIENAILEKTPIGEAVGLIKESPVIVKGGLVLWLNRKRIDAEGAGNSRLADRYDAFLSCLTGDCAALNALQAGTGAAPSGQHSGLPEQLKIKSVVVLPPEIQEGETTVITVSFQTMIGGKVNIKLQSDGSPGGPVEYNIADKKPGETDSRSFTQFFPTAGSYRLLVLASDAHSDDSARAYVVVTSKTKFDGRYTGKVVLDALKGNKRVEEQLILDFAVESGDVNGTVRFADSKVTPAIKIISKIKGKVDDKGNLTADWSYTYQISKSGGVFEFVMTAPLNGIIKDNAISGQFTCESKSTHNETAERLLKEERSRPVIDGFPNLSLEYGGPNIGVALLAHTYKNAPGRFTAQRAK